MDENNQNPNNETAVTPEELDRDRRDNAIAKAHARREVKREMAAQMTAMRAEFEAKIAAMQSGSAAGGKRAATPGDVVDSYESKYNELRAELETTKRQAKRDGVTRQLTDLLGAKGVTGVKARAAIALWEQDGQLSVDENGAKLTVGVRSKTGTEHVEFDDLGAAIDAWSRSEDAGYFLPAPTPSRPGTASNQPRKIPTWDKPARDRDEALRRTAAQLQAQGVVIPGPPSGPTDPRVAKTIADLEAKNIDILGSMLISDRGRDE